MIDPITAATHADPYPYYADLVANRPIAFDATLNMWVAAGAAEVTEVLSSPDLRVRPQNQPVPAGIRGTPVGRIFSCLVRMNDGDVHTRLKGVVSTALRRTDPRTVRARAAEATRRSLDADLERTMFTVPTSVIASLCGLPDKEAALAAELIADFVLCLRPDADADQLRAADAAAERLWRSLETAPHQGDLMAALVGAAAQVALPSPDHLTANAVGLLSQTYEATAGLIGNSLLALARQNASPDDLDPFVREVARHDAPIQNTRRFAGRPARCGTVEIEPGQTVLVLLAAANRDPAANPDPHTFSPSRANPRVFTYGAAAHRCPGQDLAVAIATGTIATLLDSGHDPVTPDTVTYRPSPNARIPNHRLVSRRR